MKRFRLLLTWLVALSFPAVAAAQGEPTDTGLPSGDVDVEVLDTGLASDGAPRGEVLDEAFEIVPVRARPRQPVQPPEPVRERRTKAPPLRFSMGGVFREDMNPGFAMSLGTQISRRERWKTDANLGFTFAHAIGVNGPWRVMSQLDAMIDLLHVPNNRLELGPTAGISHRFYNQQWRPIDNAWVPIVGARASTPLLLSRRFGWVLDVRGLVDLARTQMVLETQRIEFMSPLEIHLGMRFNFGHGRIPARREET